MATKAEFLEAFAGGRGSLAKADDNEPVIIFVGDDILAEPMLRWWADIAERMGSPKSLEMMAIADEFGRWARRHPERIKVPD